VPYELSTGSKKHLRVDCIICLLLVICRHAESCDCLRGLFISAVVVCVSEGLTVFEEMTIASGYAQLKKTDHKCMVTRKL